MWGAVAGILAASVTLAALNVLVEQKFSRKQTKEKTTFGGYLSSDTNSHTIDKASSLLKKAKKTFPRK